MSTTPRISLLVSTYNWPQALACVLEAIRHQTQHPLEVIVADDGSGDDTRTLLAQQARTFPVPLHHVWHPDAGFRAAAIRNRGIAQAQGEYIVQIDGDILLHPAALAAHARFAQRGSFVQGSRALLSAERTQSLLAGEAAEVGRRVATLGPWSRGVHGMLNAWYAPALSRWVRGSRDTVHRIRGCHIAFWRDDILRVNGYDESYEGWGREDSDLTLRLGHAGLMRRNLKFSAVAFHLWHPAAARDALDRNTHALETARLEQRVRARRGIAEHALHIAHAAPSSLSQSDAT